MWFCYFYVWTYCNKSFSFEYSKQIPSFWDPFEDWGLFVFNEAPRIYGALPHIKDKGPAFYLLLLPWTYYRLIDEKGALISSLHLSTLGLDKEACLRSVWSWFGALAVGILLNSAQGPC